MDEFLEKFQINVARIIQEIQTHELLTDRQRQYFQYRLQYHLARGRSVDLLQVIAEEWQGDEASLLELFSQLYHLEIVTNICGDRPKQVQIEYEVDSFITECNQYLVVEEAEKRYLVVKDYSLKLFAILQHKYPALQIKLAAKDVYDSLLRCVSVSSSARKACMGVGSVASALSAANYNYRFIIFVLYITSFLLLEYWSTSFAIFSTILFLTCSAFKLFLLAVSGKAELVAYGEKGYQQRDEDLPIYSILLPLYHEPNAIGRIVHAMEALDYPKHKLDICLILEEDDLETLKSVYYHALPPYFQLIIVPDKLPKTKPKAMNYAMDRIKGEYVAIYDAEDIPDPMQLRKALHKFQGLPPEYACVQSRLAFYNARESLISACLAMEYSIWFGYLLKGLSELSLPIPLGGTSNHFKVSVLRRVGLWDAYNVTEDADLGVRLHMCGYRTSILDSVTQEEGVTSLKAWMRQRSRWLKGFLQSFIVYVYATLTGSYSHFAYPEKKGIYCNLKVMSRRVADHIAIWLFLGFSLYSFIVLPLLLLFPFVVENTIFDLIWQMNFVVFIVYHYISVVVLLLYEVEISKILVIALIIWPFYFILHSVAVYFALAEIVTAPFYWNKTSHAVSKITHD